MATRTPKAVRRSYDQFCAVARGLDVIGERWTLLLVRDLLVGPKRYKDLLEGMPGIGTNLLANRLREMEDYGLVERTTLPPPSGVAVYQLTPAGEGLAPALTAIGRWGAQFLRNGPKKTDVMVPRAYFVAMRGTFNPQAAASLEATYELHVNDLVFEVRIQDGRITTREAQSSNPDATLTMDVETLNALMFRLLTPAAALESGRVQVKGDRGALERFVGVFGFHTAAGMRDTGSTHAVRNASVGARRAARKAG
ncbi:MAG TPA: winged helix-turn-helix transcriptional regulator [Candidatus Dormibacteraeota bacterium]|nr:winged helix-turn-helix transcriptional regulator [Candidatus Dormibacteraeota bacterium]